MVYVDEMFFIMLILKFITIGLKALIVYSVSGKKFYFFLVSSNNLVNREMNKQQQQQQKIVSENIKFNSILWS